MLDRSSTFITLCLLEAGGGIPPPPRKTSSCRRSQAWKKGSPGPTHKFLRIQILHGLKNILLPKCSKIKQEKLIDTILESSNKMLKSTDKTLYNASKTLDNAYRTQDIASKTMDITYKILSITIKINTMAPLNCSGKISSKIVNSRINEYYN